MKKKFDGAAFRWSGVEPATYAAENSEASGRQWRGTARHIIAGHDLGAGFHVRYFEVEPGGYTSLERHHHVHSVIGLRGRGYAVVGEEVHAVDHLDHVTVPADTPHQFVNDGNEPFGFLCVVDAERDRPQALSGDEIARLRANPATAGKIRP